MSAAEQAKQRLVAIDVGEVSIVDRPANEEPFVVTKSLEAPVGDSNSDSTVNKAGGGVTLDPYTAASVTTRAAQDLLWRIQDKMGDPSKAADVAADIERLKSMVAAAQEFQTLINKSLEPVTTLVTKAKEADDKDKPKGKLPAFMKEALAKLRESLKAMDDEPDGDEGDVAKALEVIAKAGQKQFSKDRLAKLAEAFKHMGAMYKEADAEGFKKSVEEWTAKPATATTGGSAVEGGGATTQPDPKAATPANGSVNKSDDAPAWFTKAMAEVAGKVDALTTTQATVAKRVDAIEKTDAVSKALGDTNTSSAPVEKSKGFWTGVL